MQSQDTSKKKRPAPELERVRVVFRITREVLVKRFEAIGLVIDDKSEANQESVLVRNGGLEGLLRAVGNETCEITVLCDLNPNTTRNPTTIWYADYIHVRTSDPVEIILNDPYKQLKEELMQMVETAWPIDRKQLCLDLVSSDIIKDPFSEEGRWIFNEEVSNLQFDRDVQTTQFLLEFYRKHRAECLAGIQELKNHKPEPEPEPEPVPPVPELGTGNLLGDAFKLAEAKKNGDSNGHKPEEVKPARKRGTATKK